MNKYRAFSIFLFLVFIILVFSGFAHTSIYHMLITVWMVVFSALIESKLHFIKRPDLASKKKIAYSFLILGSITTSVIVITFSNYPPENSNLIAKLIVTGTSGLVILLCFVKLFLHWNKLSAIFRIMVFIAIFVLVFSILFFWLYN